MWSTAKSEVLTKFLISLRSALKDIGFVVLFANPCVILLKESMLFFLFCFGNNIKLSDCYQKFICYRDFK